MINLPFNKWTLVFKYDKFEIEFQDQQNKTRLLAFRIFCLSLTFASLMALIIFVIQQQPIQLLLTMTGAVIGCFWFFIISSKLEAYLKHIFSGVYIWTSSTHILLSLYGQQIPQFILGFHFSLIAFCVIQFSQNGLKVFYSIITPIIMLIVYEVYELMNMQYIFHSICCWCFASFFTYMFEYTSRLAFSLNKITNYQTIINEYVNDPLLAVSLDKRTRQFNLEFKNKQLEETLNIESTNEMKQFLRSSYVINQSESLRKPCEKSSCHSSKLEEMLWKKFQSSEESIQQEDQNTFDISLISKQDEVEVEQQLKIQIKQMNFGKPILLIVIKYYEQPQIKDKYEQLLQYNNAQFITFSQQLINSLIKLSKEIKKTKSDTRNQECIPTLLALNIQIINYARNLNMFYQIGKMFQQKITQINNVCQMSFLLTYLYTLKLSHYTMDKTIKFRICYKKAILQILIQNIQLSC